MDKRWYVSLDALKAEIGETGTSNDAILGRMIERASRWLERVTDRVFIPMTATRTFDVPASLAQAGRGVLYLHDDLLAVTSLSDDQATKSSSNYFLYPLNSTPKTRLELLHSSESWYFSDTRQAAITIAGRWGFSEDTEDTGATLNGAISSTTATTFTADDGSLIEAGWCLLIDSEQMFVSSVSSNTVTVQRGNNGTTAATHSDGTTIYRYVPEPDAEEAVALKAIAYYNKRTSAGVEAESIGAYRVTYSDGAGGEALADSLALSLRRLV